MAVTRRPPKRVKQKTGRGVAEAKAKLTTLVTQYIQSFFKRQLILVPNLRIGAVWTNLREKDLQSDFFFKAGGDGVALPIRGYSDASVDACQASESPSYGGLCNDVYPPGVTATDDFAVPATIGGELGVKRSSKDGALPDCNKHLSLHASSPPPLEELLPGRRGGQLWTK